MYNDLGDDTQAVRHIDKALALCIPDKLFGILAEYRSQLGNLLDDRLLLLDSEAFELYEAINDQYDITGVTPETVVNKDGDFEFELQFEPEHVGETFFYVVKVKKAEAVFVNEYDYTPLPPEIPKTGDFTSVSLWFAIVFISGGVLVGAVAMSSKEEKKKKN